jgi:HAE1 family hydrophobic/amphiphilic exporter-1
VRGLVAGEVVSKFEDADGDSYDVRLRVDPKQRARSGDLLALDLPGQMGGVFVPLSQVARIEDGAAPSNIRRLDLVREIRVSASPQERSLGEVVNDIKAGIAKVALPPGYSITFTGDFEIMMESFGYALSALALAIILIYAILASQFRSFLQPFAIMLSLPLSLIGVAGMLWAVKDTLNMMSMIGIILLMGLVTKNAILLIDMTNHYVREGKPVEEAILTAGPIRLRPILMTTLAMILGMLPSALGRGEGGEFRAPISIATIGGLITSTGLTLVVVPVAYLLLARFLERVKNWRGNPAAARLQPAVRVTGVLIIVLLVGWFLSVTGAFAQGANGGLVGNGSTRSFLSNGSTQTPAASGSLLELTFDQALARALGANEGLKVVQEQVRESQGYVEEAKAGFLPSVNLNFLYTPAQRFPLIRIPAGVFGPDEQTFEAGFTRRNIMQVDISQPIYTAGRLTSAYGMQASALDASKLQLERARQELQYQVVEAFYAALMNEEGVRVADEQIALASRQLALAKARFDAGTVARLDVLQAEVELANSKARRIQAKASVDTSYQALRTVLSLPQSQALALRGSLDERPDTITREALDAAIPSRPDLQAFSARKDMARHAVALANADWKPSLSLTGNLQYQDDGLDNLLRSDNQSYTFGVALRVPLFAAPGAAAKRAVATAQVRQSEHGLNAATDTARLEVESAWTSLQASDEVVTTQQKALELARESVAIAQVSYENGVITSAELSDAQVRLLQTEWLLMQAKYTRIVAAARARVAAGAN